MRAEWQQFFRRRVVWIPLSLAGLFDIASWFILLRQVAPAADDELIILHYTFYYGADLVGPWTDAFLLPVFGFFLLALNTVIAFFLLERAKNLTYFFLVLTPLLEFLILSATVFLVTANVPSAI